MPQELELVTVEISDGVDERGTRIMMTNPVRHALAIAGYKDTVDPRNDRMLVLRRNTTQLPKIVVDMLNDPRRRQHHGLVRLVESDVLHEPQDDNTSNNDVDNWEMMWKREDIESAPLTKVPGLNAYVDYHSISLDGKTRADDVREVVLEWYDAQLG